MTNKADLIAQLEKTLQYFKDEFPQNTEAHNRVWTQAISYHCGGLTPNDIEALLALIRTLPAHDVDVERVARALLDCKIPDGFDRNGSHAMNQYVEYCWNLRQYLRPRDEWKATKLAEAAIASIKEQTNGKRL